MVFVFFTSVSVYFISDWLFITYLNFYVSYLFVEVLTKFLYSSLKFIEHPYNPFFELCIW